MLNEEVISISNKEKDEFYSPIFFRDKKDGTVRIILDLTQLNLLVKDQHHKLETLKTALEIIQPNDFFTSLDLKAAYYSIPLSESDKNILSLCGKGILFNIMSVLMAFVLSLEYFPKLLDKLWLFSV